MSTVVTVSRTTPSPSVNELAPLASQHHTSEYNRLKFGPKGCPITYIPLSIHLPDYFLQLQQRQQECAQEKTWWLSDKPPALPVILGSRGAQPQHSHLQQEIQAAISEPMDKVPRLPNPQDAGPSSHPVKTSSTHPINISYMVPQELLPMISSHLLFASATPTIFEVPYSFTLDRLLSPLSSHHQTGHPDSRPTATPPVKSRIDIQHFRTRSRVTDALQAAINGKYSSVSLEGVVEGKKHLPSLLSRRSASADIIPSQKLETMKYSSASSISLSLSLALSNPPPSNGNDLISRRSVSSSNDLEIIQTPVELSTHISLIPESPLMLGNLFLSSCPGKKVRLEGPVKGRSGVCRDLSLDLRRMKELRVGCIICCLDDGELNFLGAPWPEYENLANDNGIDVFRIPIPEGLAPLSPASLDENLTKIITTYTLHGIPVLVHCRGGVGRAGVIACCWLIRLGLCGWIDPPSSPDDTGNNLRGLPASLRQYETQSSSSPLKLRKDTVQFVQKVIGVARQRRSLKAVETYEQVRFLVDFVEYLRNRPHLDGL
ncbi:hypothetical protein H2248_005087 [Termitomyces sp. 'cryptogamus']|nr:hypothetical protein H2248_005087 [Termitomyces sp. 'cryptogamus']